MTELRLVVIADNFDNRIPATARTVFVVDGIAYTIDLSEENLARLREDFGRYTAVADKLGPAMVTVDGEAVGKAKKIEQAVPFGFPRDARTVQTAAVQHEGLAPAQQPQLDLERERDSFPLIDEHHHDDDFPPDKSWLHVTDREMGEPGSKARARRGTAYRRAMREWLRHNGYPQLGSKGVVPTKAVEAYWEYVTRVRAQRSDTT